jgi:hypothetical protein
MNLRDKAANLILPAAMSAGMPFSVPLHSVDLTSQPRVFAQDMRYGRNIEIMREGILVEEREYPIVYDCRHGNLVMNVGRVNMLQSQFLTGAVAIIAGGVGSNNANTTDATQVHLGAELIAGTSRPTLTNTSGTTLSTVSASSAITLVTGQSYNEIITAQWQYATGDANNGSTFAEYGMFSSTTLPGTSTGTSGTMFARYVPTSSFTKTSSFLVTIQWSIGL